MTRKLGQSTSFVSRLRGVSVKQLRSWIGLRTDTISRFLSLTSKKLLQRKIFSRFTVRPDGRTPFQYLLGTPYVSPLCIFGESVFALIPDHEVRAAKLTNRWTSGCWWGRSDFLVWKWTLEYLDLWLHVQTKGCRQQRQGVEIPTALPLALPPEEHVPEMRGQGVHAKAFRIRAFCSEIGRFLGCLACETPRPGKSHTRECKSYQDAWDGSRRTASAEEVKQKQPL